MMIRRNDIIDSLKLLTLKTCQLLPQDLRIRAPSLALGSSMFGATTRTASLVMIAIRYAYFYS
jgi:hypothetical protein